MFVKVIRNGHVSLYEGDHVRVSYLHDNSGDHMNIVIEPSLMTVLVNMKEKDEKKKAHVYLMNDKGQTVEKLQ